MTEFTSPDNAISVTTNPVSIYELFSKDQESTDLARIRGTSNPQDNPVGFTISNLLGDSDLKNTSGK